MTTYQHSCHLNSQTKHSQRSQCYRGYLCLRSRSSRCNLTVVVGVPFGRPSVTLFEKENPQQQCAVWQCAAGGGEYQLTSRAVAVPMRKAMPREMMVVEYIVPMDDLNLDGLMQLKLC